MKVPVFLILIFSVSLWAADSSRTVVDPAKPIVPQSKPDRIRFAFFSDTHLTGEAVEVSGRFPKSVDFVVFGGDAIHRNGGAPGWNRFWQVADQLFPAKPMVFVVGNHDVDGTKNGEWREQIGYPVPKLPYAIDAGPVRLVVMNSNLETHSDWDAALLELEKLFSDSHPWKVLAVHHPFFSFKQSKLSAARASTQVLLSRFLGKLQTWGVDLVLSGDAHLFQHIQRNCVDFLVAGSLTGMLHSGPEKFWFYEGTQKWASEPTVTYIEASRETLKVETRGKDAKPLHTFTRTRGSNATN